MHHQDNRQYLDSLRSPKGGIGQSMLTRLSVPPKPKKGWIERLALAPFSLRTATREEIAQLWVKAKLPESVSKVYSLRSEPETAPASTVTIHFDGGTPCNIPARGYGIGYGSYRINSGPVVRVDHARPMSNNAAEIWTLCSALESLPVADADTVGLIVRGDSQIALKWAKAARRVQATGKGSGEFISAIARLCELVPRFHSIRTEWLPRVHAVRAFGH